MIIIKAKDQKELKEKLKDVKKSGKVLAMVDGRRKVMTVNVDPSKTDGSYKKDCDANEVIKKFLKTGVIDHVKQGQGYYGDISDMPGLLEGMERINQAKDEFMQVPAKIRAMFQNDVRNFYNYVADPANQEHCVELGLIPKPKSSPSSEPVASGGDSNDKESPKDSQ